MKYSDDLYFPALKMKLKKLLSLHRHCDECGCPPLKKICFFGVRPQ